MTDSVEVKGETGPRAEKTAIYRNRTGGHFVSRRNPDHTVRHRARHAIGRDGTGYFKQTIAHLAGHPIRAGRLSSHRKRILRDGA